MSYGEPWKFDTLKGRLAILTKLDEVLFLEDSGIGEGDHCLPDDEDVYQRIVASVNFCRNIPTELLAKMEPAVIETHTHERR